MAPNGGAFGLGEWPYRVMAWHELHHAYVAASFVRRYQGILNNYIRIAESRYAVGRAAQQDIFKAQTQYAIFETQLLRWDEQRVAKTAAINALLNRPQGSPIETPLEIPPGDMKITLDELLVHARVHSPMLANRRDGENDCASFLPASYAS